MNDETPAVCGPEVFSEMQRLICEWYGLDANEQTGAIPKLVHDLVQLQHNGAVTARVACHDCAEAV
jgi:hypothetical protein